MVDQDGSSLTARSPSHPFGDLLRAYLAQSSPDSLQELETNNTCSTEGDSPGKTINLTKPGPWDRIPRIPYNSKDPLRYHGKTLVPVQYTTFIQYDQLQ